VARHLLADGHDVWIAGGNVAVEPLTPIEVVTLLPPALTGDVSRVVVEPTIPPVVPVCSVVVVVAIVLGSPASDVLGAIGVDVVELVVVDSHVVVVSPYVVVMLWQVHCVCCVVVVWQPWLIAHSI
jgi:hypothetical protein